MGDVRSVLLDALRIALNGIGVDSSVAVVLEPSARPEFGDWSTPAALSSARVLRRSPMEIAGQLRDALERQPLDLVAGWTVSPPGYVNAQLNDSVWARQVIGAALRLDAARPLELPAGYAAVRGKTLVEHTATNPNKAAHIGHLRNACIGDTVARVLRRSGHQVEVDNYIDDTGVQVADVVVGIRELGFEAGPDEAFDEFCSRVYVEVSRRYEEDPSLVQLRNGVLHEIEQGGNDTARYVKELARRIVDAHLATMGRFDIAYDLLTWESDILGLGFLEQALALLRETGAIVFVATGKFAGCWVMPPDGDEPATDDDETKVLVKSDGIATYTAKDIAYQLWKFGLLGRDFHYRRWHAEDPAGPVTTAAHPPDDLPAHFGKARRVVNVIDARQAYPQQVVQRALARLGHREEAERSLHLAYEVVALTPAAASVLGVPVEPGREMVAMSGRRGIEVRADALLDRTIERVRGKARDEHTARLLAAGAVRYYLLKFSLTQIIAFDFDEALRTTGDTGVYLQYAHARASGILRKVPDDGADAPVIPPALDPSERALLHRIDGHARALAETAVSLSPSVLTAYAFALASALSDFYEHTPPIVREQDATVRVFRRALVAATRARLADTLHTLGMAAPDQV
ncbi:MAG TPA: arginine--tRNA ligase [Candidatus Dormibacteraeota bacterium]